MSVVEILKQAESVSEGFSKAMQNVQLEWQTPEATKAIVCQMILIRGELAALRFTIQQAISAKG